MGLIPSLSVDAENMPENAAYFRGGSCDKIHDKSLHRHLYDTLQHTDWGINPRVIQEHCFNMEINSFLYKNSIIIINILIKTDKRHIFLF